MTANIKGQALVRKLWPHERDAYLAHLIRLDHRTRICRFGRLPDDAALARYAAHHFNVDSLIFGAFAAGRVCAAGELHADWLDNRAPAEAALSVEPDWRRRGLGSAMMDRMLTAARNRGRRQVMFLCLPENLPMRRLVETRCADCFSQLDPETGRVRLEVATPAT